MYKHFAARDWSVHSFFQDSPVCAMDYASESIFEKILASVLDERFPEI